MTPRENAPVDRIHERLDQIFEATSDIKTDLAQLKGEHSGCRQQVLRLQGVVDEMIPRIACLDTHGRSDRSRIDSLSVKAWGKVLAVVGTFMVAVTAGAVSIINAMSTKQ